MDENLSVVLSNRLGSNRKKISENSVYTGKQLKDLFLLGDKSVAKALDDVKGLYFDNDDRPHTNLFYSCFRLWFAGIATTDFRKIIDHGCKLNLLFFSLSFCFMFMLLRKLFGKDRVMIPFSLLIAFGNTGAISNTLFLRPYQLQETLLILFTYMFVKLLDLIKNQKELMTLKNFCKFVPVTGLTLLSGYFAAIYVLMLILILAIYCRTAKQKQNEKFIGISLLLSILFARLLFCGFFYGFSCGRAGEAYKKFSFSAISENFCNSCVAYFNIIHDHLFNVCIFGILLVVVTVVLVRRIKTIFDEKILLIFLSCFLWSFTCIFLAPFKLLRYTMACFPLFTLIFPYVILQIKKRGIRCVAAASTIFLTSGFWDSSAKIDFLFTGQSKRAESFTSKSDARVFIFSKWCDCEPAPILHLLSDEQYYEFPKSKERLAARLKEPAFVLFTEEYSDKDIQDFIPEGFTFIYKDEYSLFSVYEAKSVSADYFFDKK